MSPGSQIPFDPTAPLAGPPEPWAASDTPSHRDGSPYHMTDMIAAEPHLARRLIGRLGQPDGAAERLARVLREVATAGDGVVLTGCGTSEHGALGAVDILAEAFQAAGLPSGGLASVQAFELAQDPPPSGLVVGISHEGGTWATNRALSAAHDAGARIAAVTASDRAPVAAIADPALVVATGELDASWCHTVGYVSPLLVAAAVGSHLSGRSPEPERVASLMAAAAADTGAAEATAAELAGTERIVVIASGVDRAAGRELTLKIEEGAWLPTAYRDLETFLHGHLPAIDERTGLVLILSDRQRRAERLARARAAIAAARTVGARVAAIVADGVAQELAAATTPAGRLVVPDATELPDPVAALLGTAMALQLLTERLARARGTNPDVIRRDDKVYRDAAEAAERA